MSIQKNKYGRYVFNAGNQYIGVFKTEPLAIEAESNALKQRSIIKKPINTDQSIDTLGLLNRAWT